MSDPYKDLKQYNELRKQIEETSLKERLTFVGAPNYIKKEHNFTISSEPVNPHPAIVSPPVKVEKRCSFTGHRHVAQQESETVISETKPFYCLGSFCRLVKIQMKCVCGEKVYRARLHLGDIYITGEWPEELE